MKILTKKLQTSLVKSIYLHIPFCGIVCPFCPFTVKRDRLNLHEKYIFGVLNEIEYRVGILNEIDLLANEKKTMRKNYLESLYIGGGTPSRLKMHNVSLLIKKIKNIFPWSKKIEISFEMNPEDVTEKYLNDLYEIGVNRISLGGQSFQTSILKQLGRSHSSHELREAIEIIRNSAIKNWNLDLIFGVPKQSFLKFKDDLEEALIYRPSHISLYGLEIHKKTRFGKDQEIINWELNNRDLFREMYLWAINRLKKSHLFQYEVSNFSQKGKESRNNLLVWSGYEYLGFGIGAHSFFKRMRWSNKNSIKLYLDDLHKKIMPVGFEEELSKKQLATEFIMLSLRQRKGFNIDVWQNKFGLELKKKQLDFTKSLCDSGLAFWEDNNLCLTPKGFLISDRIILEILPFNSII
tara:strand:+ start:3176 stop:4396 length:1221 start_codon:yes stop_codon:yes gene_type:complete